MGREARITESGAVSVLQRLCRKGWNEESSAAAVAEAMRHTGAVALARRDAADSGDKRAFRRSNLHSHIENMIRYVLKTLHPAARFG